jgi:transcriptional regulator with XRE-family HTH domain
LRNKRAAKRFGARLRKWRIEGGYTQRDLAFKLDCSETTILGWELAKSLPTYKHLKRNIKELTGIDVDTIKRGEDTED